MMKGTTKERYTLVSSAGQDLFEFQILAIFALKSARKQASNASYMLKTAKLSKFKVLKHPPLSHCFIRQNIGFGLEIRQNRQICVA